MHAKIQDQNQPTPKMKWIQNKVDISKNQKKDLPTRLALPVQKKVIENLFKSICDGKENLSQLVLIVTDLDKFNTFYFF